MSGKKNQSFSEKNGKKSKRSQKPRRDADDAPLTTDPRFAHVHRDPRFIRPRRKDFKVTIDNRFAGMLKNKDFSDAPKVDKYGRPLKAISAEEELKKFYKIESEDEDDDEVGNLESANEDDEHWDDDLSVEALEQELVAEEDLSDVDHEKKEPGYDPMRGKGVMFSDSDSDGNGEAELQEESEDEESQIPIGNETNRFAVVNLDWDHVKSVDLFKVFMGFKPDNGIIRSVRIYPSTFGKDRLSKEEVEGPPKEIFKDYKNDDKDAMIITDEIDAKELQKAQADNGDEFDMSALRRYQLDRLRYYYAVVECDTVDTARAIYKACDGAEYERSANFFDLRYISDEMEFEDEPRDQAFHAPETYKPLDFQTEALQHSKVKLTWDEEDPDRTRITRRKFTKEDLKDMDFKTYLASSSEGDSDEDNTEFARRKYKKLLVSGGAEDGGEEKGGEDGEMEVTFAPGLSEVSTGLFEKKEEERMENETSLEQYIRKQKERKKARKAKRNGVSEETDIDGKGAREPFSDDDVDIDMSDSFFADALNEKDGSLKLKPKIAGNRSKKTDKKRKSKEEWAEEVRKKAELELLFGDEQDQNEGFNLKQMMKAEKSKTKKKRRNGETAQEDDDFELDVNDPRFTAVGLNHEFAIDPTNPHFKKTSGMKKLLESKRSTRSENVIPNTFKQLDDVPRRKPESSSAFTDPNLSSLVDSVKRKSAMAATDQGGRRKKKKLVVE